VSWKRALAKLGGRSFGSTSESKLAALAASLANAARVGPYGQKRQFQARLSLYAYISPPGAAEVARRAGEAAQGGEI